MHPTPIQVRNFTERLRKLSTLGCFSNSRGGQHSNRVHIQVCGELGQNEVEPGDTLRPQATLQDGEYALSQNPEREARISQVGHYLHDHIADHD